MFNLKNLIRFIYIVTIIVVFINYPMIITIAILCLFFIIEFSLFSYIYSSVNTDFEIVDE